MNGNTKPRRTWQERRATAWAVASASAFAGVAAVATSTPAWADALRFEGDAAKNAGVVVVGVADGEVTYRSPGGRMVSRPLAELTAIELDQHPGLAEADALVADGKPGRAAGLLRREVQQATTDWARDLLQQRLVDALDAAGQAQPAVMTYLRLASQTAEPGFLSRPPVASLRAAPDNQKQQLGQRVLALRNRTPALAETLAPLLAAAGLGEPGADTSSEPADAAPPAVGPGAGAAGTGAAGGAASGGSPNAGSAVVLVDGVDENAEIVRLLRAGEFEQAVTLGERLVEQPGGLPMHLYLLGVARLGVAEQTGAERDYLDAGLPLMRTAVHFGRNGTPEVVASLVEAGYVHAQIGRADVAQELYRLASAQLDEQETPELAKRLEELRAALPAADTGDDAG